jgi:HYR domain
MATGTAAQAASPCTTVGTTVTCTYTGAGTYSFSVPTGVTSLDVTAVGAAGGFGCKCNRDAEPGGLGASVEDTAVPVNTYQNQALSVVVGGVGGTGSFSEGSVVAAGGSPGGGGAAGNNQVGGEPFSGGGGGYSGLLDPSGNPLMIAGGGGGGSIGSDGGAGDTGSGGAAGGSVSVPCPATPPSLNHGCGGGGGTSTMGGAGGAGGSGFAPVYPPGVAGAPGTFLAGGQGGATNSFNGQITANSINGGGGGGGYYGGGGGGSDGENPGGGGGGSSFGTGPGLTNETNTTAAAQVIITYQLPDNDLSITTPASITTDATGASGATVTYTAPTVSDPDGDATPPTAVCSPASGSTFAVGTTTVNCSATDSDDANSPVTTSFTVTVKGAAAQVSDLTGLVASFNLSTGAQSSFDTQLQAVQSDLQVGNTTQACGDLGAVINHAKAQSGKQLTVSQANQIIAAAKQAQAVLGC